MLRDVPLAGPNQCIVSGIGHEKEPITAAASRLPWMRLSEEGHSDWTGCWGFIPRAAQTWTCPASGSATGAGAGISSRRGPYFHAFGQANDGEELTEGL